MRDQGTGQEIDPQRAAMDYNRQLSQPSYVTEQQEWNRVHAQLLKSVADAQAKLLAAQNETCDLLEGLKKEVDGIPIKHIVGRLDAIGSLLAELLQLKSYRTLAKSKRNRPKR